MQIQDRHISKLLFNSLIDEGACKKDTTSSMEGSKEHSGTPK